MHHEIIVVDDDGNLAELYRERINKLTKISAVATDDPEEAKALVKNHPIKIALLDQKMPRLTGTELFKEIQKIDSLIKGIMITGEAETDEVGEALNLGFSDYIHKSDIKNLGKKIFYLYAQYYNDKLLSNSDTEPVEIFEKKKLAIIPRHKIRYKIISTELVDQDYVLPENWKTIAQINAGEKRKITDKIQITDKIIIEESSELNLKSRLGVSSQELIKFNQEIESLINSRFATTLSNEKVFSTEITKEYELQPEPKDLEKVYVRSRHLLRAMVFKKIVVIMEVDCNCCNIKKTVSFTVVQPTKKLQTKQIDYLSNGSEKVHLTGTTFS